MIIFSGQVRRALKTVWPGLKYIVLTDPAWIAPALNDFKTYFTGLGSPAYIEQVWECEEIALDAMLRHRAQQIKTYSGEPSEPCNWAMGFVGGTRFNGVNMNHFCNICITESGVYLADQQSGNVWTPDRGSDEIYFLFM
jgi:hypothetical protein